MKINASPLHLALVALGIAASAAVYWAVGHYLDNRYRRAA